MAKAEENLGWVLLGTLTFFAIISFIIRKTYQPST